MKKVLTIGFILIITFATLQADPGSLAENQKVAAKIKLIEVWINQLLDYYKVPGLVAGIVYDQELIWANGFGYKDLETNEKMTTEVMFRIASISKLFTSTAILQLRDKGKLRLDDPIRQYLDWFKIRNPYDDAPEVTIRHILTHTSGLPREAAFPYWTDGNFPTLEQIIATLPEQEMIFPPETKWKYSNLAMALLGEIVASASGVPYQTYINDNILYPLNLKNTRVTLDDEDKVRLATGYQRNRNLDERGLAGFTDSKGITPAADFTTNVYDLSKFMSLHFKYEGNTSEQIVKGSTLKEMHRVHWLRPSWTSGWGLGFGVSKVDDQVFVGHGGWVDGFRSAFQFLPEDKIGAIVFINTDDYSPLTICRQIIKLISPVIKEALPEEKKEDSFRDSWLSYEGIYYDTSHWRTDIIILDKKLYLYNYGYPPSTKPKGNLTRLFPVKEKTDTFRMTGADGNGEYVIFQLNKTGSVKQIKVGENYIYPVQ